MNLADLILPTLESGGNGGMAENQQRRGIGVAEDWRETGGTALKIMTVTNNPPLSAKGGGDSSPVTAGLSANPPNPPAPRLNIETPIPLDIEYFATQGVDLMQDDLVFLKSYLPEGTTMRNELIRGYIVSD